MLRQNRRLVETGLRLFDVLVLLAAWPAAHLALSWRHGVPTTFTFEHESLELAVIVLAWLGSSWLTNVYDVYRTRRITTELWRMVHSLLLTGVGVAATGFIDGSPKRALVASFFVIALSLLAANRLLLRLAARVARRRGFNTRYFAVVGSGDQAEDVVETVASHAEWGYTFAGYVLEDDVPPVNCDVPVLGRLRELGSILENQVIDEVYFAVPRHRLDRIESALLVCEEQGVASRVSLNLFSEGRARMSLSEMDGLPILSFSMTPSDELALLAKRAFDVVVSGAMLLLLAPMLALAALAIRLESPGPVFFRQRRVGLNGREFTLFKFRSMQRDAEALLGALRARNEMSGPVFKMRSDPRVTRVGAFIRRTSLDELPQLWNVLRGEMSIVGPRPPLPAEVRQYKRWQRRRLSMKPGITCTWQVSGRNNIDFDRWMELDLEYIDRWSLWNDVQICMRTIPAVLSSRGAS